MNVFVSPSGNDVGKFQALVGAFPDIWEGLILDVGCRSGNLKRVLLKGKLSYRGLDLNPPADIIGNLEVRLPFQNGSFNVVVVLDVLEHTDNIHRAFSELCRVSRRYLLITLPNAYDIKSRVKFLLGRRLSGKYGLPPDPPDDRHRWLFSFSETRDFALARGTHQGFEIAGEGGLIGPGRAALGGRWIAGLLLNLFSPWYVCFLKRR